MSRRKVLLVLSAERRDFYLLADSTVFLDLDDLSSVAIPILNTLHARYDDTNDKQRSNKTQRARA